jgi:Pin2-interacting protein X1
MTALGWTDNSGIGGASLTGNANHIAVVHKLDSSGIGMARAMKEGEAVGGQARAGLDDVLRRLASASSSPAPMPDTKPALVPVNNRIA